MTEKKETTWEKWLKDCDANQIPNYEHEKLQSLSQDQRDKLKCLITETIDWFRFGEFIDQELPQTYSNDEQRRVLESIHNLLMKLEMRFEQLHPSIMLMLENDINKLVPNTDSKILLFPKTALEIKSRISELLNQKTYSCQYKGKERGLLAADTARDLITEFGFQPTLTVNGLWHSLTYHFVLYGIGKNETDENIKNLLRGARKV